MVISYFIPEIGSAAHIYHDLAKGFIARGHEVSVITSYPRKYNLSEEDADKDFPLEETVDGIRIYRVENKVDRDNLFSRGLEHFLLPGKFLKVFKRTKKDFNVCLIYIPPLPLYRFALKIKKIAGIPSVLNFQDFHPQELTDVGVLKNPIIIKILKHMEREAYSKADYCVALTPGGVDYIVERGGDPHKVSHIYNAVSNELHDRCQCDFKIKESIQDKFLITYGGILSSFQGIDNILTAAKIMDEQDIIFYLIGDGVQKSHLESRIKNEGIKNVKMLPLQSRENYLNIIGSSDLSIVSLDNRMNAPCFPGKTINIMSLGIPILGILPNSETLSIINRTESGIVVDPNDIIGIRKTIIELKSNPSLLTRLGMNGKNFALIELDNKKIINDFIIIFEGLKKS